MEVCASMEVSALDVSWRCALQICILLTFTPLSAILVVFCDHMGWMKFWNDADLPSTHTVWLGDRVVRMLDLQWTGRGFESWPPRCRVQPWASCQHSFSVTNQYNLVPATGRWCLAFGKVTISLASHWPRVTDISVLHLWAEGLGEGDQHLRTLS